MRNPFKTQLTGPIGSYWSPQPSEIAADTNATVHSIDVVLDDGYVPGTQHGPVGMVDDNMPSAFVPMYAGGDESREIIFTPGPQSGYTYLPQDRINREDVGSVPGTNYVNIHHGPVGLEANGFLAGNKTPTYSTPPAYYGPVGRTSPDYAAAVAYANFQNSFSNVSNQAANTAAVAAI